MRNFNLLARIGLTFSLLTLIFLVSCENANSPVNSNEFAGQVITKDSKPIDKALVAAVNLNDSVITSDVTKSDGSFLLIGLPEKKDGIEIRISHPDYNTYYEKLTTISTNAVNSKNKIKIQNDDSCCGTTNISVVDNETNKPLQYADVKFVKNQQIVRREKTDENGLLVYKNLCLGVYSVRIARDGYKVIEQSLTISNCDGINLAYNLVSNVEKKDSCCNGIIKLWFKDSATQDILKNCYITLTKDGVKLGDYKSLEESYTLRELCPGKYNFRIVRDGYQVLEFSQDMNCNDTLEITKNLVKKECCEGLIKLWLKDEATQDILKGSTVTLTKGGVKLGDYKSEDQFLTLRSLCVGTYNFRIARDGYKVFEFSQEITCNDTLEITKTLVKSECCNGVIKLTLKDSTSNDLIKNATLYLRQGSAVLREVKQEGDYIYLLNLCEGEYSILVKRENYKSIEFPVNLKCNDTLQLTKIMVSGVPCCNGVAKIILKDAATQETLKGYKIVLWKAGVKIAEYSPEGEYLYLQGLCEGTYGVNATKDGYKGIEFSFTIKCNDQQIITKTMAKSGDLCCDGVVVLTLTDKLNQPLKGAVVKLWQGSTKLALVYTDDNGVVKFRELCVGKYAISISKDGYKGGEFPFEIACHDSLNFNKQLELNTGDCCTGIMKLKILDKATQLPITNAIIKVYLDGAVKYDGVSNAEGWYAEDGICSPKTYKVVVSREGYVSQELTITYSECKTIIETVQLEK